MAQRKASSRIRDAEASKVRILAAARDEFCELGLAGARVDDIADRAEINKRMLYHYFGDKEGLYRAVLEDSYREIREGEQALDLSNWSPDHGMRHLTTFTFRHFETHPWFVKLLINENMYGAQYLQQLTNVADMHPPLVAQIEDLLRRGERLKIFRAGVDPKALYVTIAALGFFYFSNANTLSFVFSHEFLSKESIDQWEQHMVDVIMSYLRP